MFQITGFNQIFSGKMMVKKPQILLEPMALWQMVRDLVAAIQSERHGAILIMTETLIFCGNFAHKDGRGNQPESVWLRNSGKENQFKFENKGQGGVFYQESYSSPAASDYDNDGNLDLFFTTVYGVASFGRKNNPVLFRNQGDFKFINANTEAKLEGLGTTYQAAWADFDNDGDLDNVQAFFRE